MAENKAKTIKKTTAAVKTVKKAVEPKATKKVEVKAEVKKTAVKTVKPVAEKAREFKVFVRNVQESPLKLRLVANLTRNKGVEKALTELEFLNKKGSLFMRKAIESGIANAKENAGIEKKDLYVKSISVGEGVSLKRFKIASRSRVAGIAKRRSHINLVLSVK